MPTSSPSTRTPFGSSASVDRAENEIDQTLEELLELPGKYAAERKRDVALILDEFQEVVEIDPKLPKLMRSVFEEQPEVGGGSTSAPSGT